MQDTKKELEETRTAYQQTLKAVDLLHVKYNDKLDVKEKEYRAELKQKSDQLEIELERIKNLKEEIKTIKEK